MNPEPLLLAFHVTLALGLTILLGIQIVALGRIRTAVTPEQRRPLSSSIMAAITAVPIVTLVVAVTGGMLLGQGARGGPWIGAGVFSALVIATTALWTLRQARRGHDRRGRRLGSAITAAQSGCSGVHPRGRLPDGLPARHRRGCPEPRARCHRGDRGGLLDHAEDTSNDVTALPALPAPARPDRGTQAKRAAAPAEVPHYAARR